MKSLVVVLVVVVASISVVGFLVFNENFNDPTKDFKKQTEFLSSKKDPILTNSNNFEPILVLNEDSDMILEEPSFYEDLRPPMKSVITAEIRQANEFYEEKNFQEALLLYDEVLSTDPTNVYALNGKGGTLLSLKEFDGAIATFNRTIQFYPDNVNAINGKAYSLYLKAFPYSLPGLFKESIGIYHKALQLDPNNLNSLNGLASALVALDRYDEAIQYYNQSLSVDPENDNARNGLINLWIKRGNLEVRFFYFESAIQYFDNALKLDPNHVNALLSKAGAYTEWGKSKQVHYDTAEKQFNHILEIYPDNVEGLVGMGYVLNEQLKFEQALPYYEKALELDPEHFNAQRGKSLALRHVLYGGN